MLALTAASARADVIFSENFENSGLGPGTFNGGFGAFTIVTDGQNQLNPGTGNAWLSPMPPQLGTTFATLFASAVVDANLPQTYEANTTYTLTFTHFRRDDIGADGIGARFMTPALAVAGSQLFPAVQEFDTFVPRTWALTIPSDSPLVGQNIKLRLFSDPATPSNPPQGGIDNIVLTARPDVDPPAIAALAPTGGAAVYPGVAIVATFNEPIALTGGGSISLTDTGDGSGTVTMNLADSSQVAVSGRNLILTPPARLAFGTPFEVMITAGTIRDLAPTPNPFAGTTAGQWTFTTSAQEFTAPGISATNPADDATDASVTSLTVTFDQNLLLASGAATVIFEEGFESGNGGFTASGSPNDWAWGTPDSDNGVNLEVTTGNGGSANCWATHLGPAGSPPGAVTPGADSILTGPDAGGNGIDLTGVVGARLQFAAALDAAAGDVVEVRVREVGTGDLLATLLPFGPSPLAAGRTAGWATYGPFDLSAAEGSKVYLEFRYQGTDGNFIGLYLDDVRVTGVDPSKAITLRNLTAGADTVIPADDTSRVSVNGSTLTIATGPLALETEYAVRIGAGMLRNFSDLGFAGIGNDTDWNFTTGHIIASDTLTGATAGSPLTGRLPEIRVADAAWIRPTNPNSFAVTSADGSGNPPPSASGEAQGASAILIASAGAYSKPTRLSISADLAPRNTEGPASGGRGVALGFYSAVGGNEFSQNRFTGLVLDNAGNLNLVQDPNATGFFTGPGAFLGTPVPFAGAWDRNVLRRLSYNVDLETGAISNISLEGSSATYSFTTALFTDAATRYAGVYSSGAVGGSFSAMDNFVVAAVTTIPQLFATSPADNASGVLRGVNLVATFNQEVKPGPSGTITLRRSSNNSIVESFDVATSAGLTFTGSSVTINPTVNLDFGMAYHVLMDPTVIESLDGVPFPGIGDPSIWNFTTVLQEFTAPIITTTNPQDGAINAPMTKPLAVTFNQNIQLASGATTVIYEEGFESGNGGFTTSGSPNDWVWGTPDSDNGFNLEVTTGNRGSASCWATNPGPAGTLPGAITLGTNSLLTGPDAAGNGIDLTGVGEARLHFAAAVDATVGDVIEVRVREVATNTLLATLLPFGSSPLETALTADWATYGPFDLSDAAGHKVYLEFRYQGTDNSFIGLYLDDVRVTAVDPSKTITLRNLTDGIDTVIPVNDVSRVAVSGDTLTISPGSLLPNTDYAVRIGAAAVINANDLGFAGISDDTTWNFASTPVIAGVTIERFSSQLAAGFNRRADFVVDGSGFESGGPGTHSTAPDGTMWLSNGTFAGGTDPIGPFPNSSIEFNLGGNYDLLSLTVWNYNELAAGLSTRGAKDVTISVASSVGGDFSSLGTFIFDQAPGDGGLDFGQFIDLSNLQADNVRLVRFDITSNHNGDNNFVGLSEVRFAGLVTSEPGGDTFAGWIAGFPGVGAQIGFDQDPDGDGIANGVEAWFGTDPAAASAGLTQLSKTDSVFSVQHPVADPLLSDVSGSYEWSLDLVTWHPATTITVGDTRVTIASTSNAGIATVTADTAGSVNPPLTLFLRAVATRN